MHIDLNSCFAIIEQQANRLLRGRPVGIGAYDTPRGFLVASSYQAKAKGVKLGVNVEQARSLCPGIVIMTPDPAKYREAHKLFKAVLLEYSPDVVPKSIDEFIVNLEHSPALKSTKSEIRNSKQTPNPKIQISNISYQISESERVIHNEAMKQIATDIKKRIADSLGEYVTVNIGIATNKFLAKYGAGFGKPDGMTLIDHTNLRDLYSSSKLMDFPGINTRYRARLRVAGIYTPLDFLDADLNTLRKQVFKSIVGYYWFLQLRGHEIETKESKRQSIGHQYALSEKTMDLDKLEPMLLKLCEKTGRRLRKNNLYASGIHLYLGFAQDSLYSGYARQGSEQFAVSSEEFRHKRQESFQGATTPSTLHPNPYASSWHHGEKVYHRLYSTPDIYQAAKKLLLQAKIPNNVKIIAVTVFELQDWDPVQLSIFDAEESKVEGRKSKVATIATDIRSMDARKRTSDAVDSINNRYGEFVVTPAMMMDMSGTILDRIAFGQVRDM